MKYETVMEDMHGSVLGKRIEFRNGVEIPILTIEINEPHSRGRRIAEEFQLGDSVTMEVRRRVE